MTSSISSQSFSRFFLLQMDSIEQTPTGWEAPAMMGWSQQTPPPGHPLGQVSSQVRRPGIYLTVAVLCQDPCLACPWSSMWCSKATEEGGFPGVASKERFSKVCRFAQEFLILQLLIRQFI